MKKRVLGVLKALSAYVVFGLMHVLVVVGVIGELFPAVIPDWLWTAGGIICAPFIIAFFVCIFKEDHKVRKNKKEKKG